MVHVRPCPWFDWLVELIFIYFMGHALSCSDTMQVVMWQRFVCCFGLYLPPPLVWVCLKEKCDEEVLAGKVVAMTVGTVRCDYILYADPVLLVWYYVKFVESMSQQSDNPSTKVMVPFVV